MPFILLNTAYSPNQYSSALQSQKNFIYIVLSILQSKLYTFIKLSSKCASNNNIKSHNLSSSIPSSKTFVYHRNQQTTSLYNQIRLCPYQYLVIFNKLSVMDFTHNQHSLSPERILLLSGCINQSRTGLLYTQNQLNSTQNSFRQGQNTSETRLFKLQIQDKYRKCEHNQKYLFPRSICFQDDSDQQEIQRSLCDSRLYNLSSQNSQVHEQQRKLKKSRSQLSRGLFRHALQMQRQQQQFHDVSKSKGRQKSGNLTPKSSVAFKKLLRDKQNNLNFQNLKEQRQTTCRKQMTKSKDKVCCLSGSKVGKGKKITIPRINIPGSMTPQIKCFKDLGKLDLRR